MFRVYDSHALRVDGTVPPIVLIEYRSAAELSDDEVRLTLDLGEEHLASGSPYLPIAVPGPDGSILRPRHRRMLSDWLSDRREDLARDNFCLILVAPDRLARAIWRIVNRFRAPSLRAVTVTDLKAAADAARRELIRMGEPLSAELEATLNSLCARDRAWKASAARHTRGALMSEITIWHNPRCSKSRQTLQLIRDRGVEPTIVEYLKDPPSNKQLEEALRALDLEPRALMRKKEAPYEALGLDDPGLSRSALVAAMAENPVLIERPIVFVGARAALGRPPENVLTLLD